MTVEACGAEAAAALASVHASAFAGRAERPWSEAEFTLLLGQPGVQALVDGVPPRGFALWRIIGTEAELLTLAVLPEVRRQGVAARLVGEVIGRAAATVAERLVLEVGCENKPALRLYGGTGFREVARRPDYYERNGRREDALVLARSIGGPRTKE